MPGAAFREREPLEWCLHFQTCAAFPEAGVMIDFAGDTPVELFDPVAGEEVEWPEK